MKTMKQLYLAAAALMALAACSSDDDALSAYHNDPTAVRISAQVGTAPTDGFTRSNPIDANKQTAFNSGDKISVSADGQDAVTYEYNGTEWLPQDGKYLKWESDEMQFKAYYPATFAGTITQPKTYATEADLAAADFMTFSGTQTNTNGNKLSLTMERQMARVIVVIDDFNNQYSSDAKVESVSLCGDVVAYKQDKTFYALIKPGYKASDDANFLTLTVKDGEAITTETLATFPTFEAGKSYTNTLTVGKNKLQIVNVTVKDWGAGGVIGEENNKSECIGVTTEAQLRAAFEQGGNIKLGTDITLSSSFSLYDSQKTITLDLNGHTLSYGYSIFYIDNGTLNIKNGTLETANFSCSAIYVRGGILNVENCTLKSFSDVCIQNSGTSTFTNCTFNGTVSATEGNIYLVNQGDGSTTFGYGSGGGGTTYPGRIVVQDNGKVISNFDPTSNKQSDSKVINNGDGTWTVFNNIDTEDLLQAALNAGGSYTLGGDITLSKKLNVKYSGKTTTLDLNNHTLSYDGSDDLMYVYISGDNHKLTLKNGSLTSTSPGSNVLTINCGNVDIENCTLTANDQVLYHQTNSAFTFTMSNSTVNGVLSFSTLATVNLKSLTFGKGSDGSDGGIQVSKGSVTCDFDPAGNVLAGGITANADNTWTITAAN